MTDLCTSCLSTIAVRSIGIELYEKRNAANVGVISGAANRVAVRVIRTDEECMIAQTVCLVLGLG